MPTSRTKLLVLITFVLGGIGTAHAQDTIDRLQPLVELSAHRLSIAERVAFAKWDNRTPVEDTTREVQVIANAVKEGELKDLNPESVSDFFRAQIEANKLVQFSLLADWNRLGEAPAHSRIDLSAEIRPELDRLQKEMIQQLADTSLLREGPACQANVAKAVGKYLTVHHIDAKDLQAIALDRAMAASCSR